MATRTVEQHLAESSEKLRASAAAHGFKLSAAEADVLACAGAAALVRTFAAECDGWTEDEAEALAERFVDAARHCARRAAR
jgi:hypothetical protein